MALDQLRIGIVGAASLLGKELSEEIADSALGVSEVVLLDDVSAEGQIATAGDEATFIQRLNASSFAGLDFVFFTGDEALARKHIDGARSAGATVIDVTGALAGEPEVLVWSPWLGAVETAAKPDLKTTALVAPHAAALMLALVASRLRTLGTVQTCVATVLQPASEQGRAGMDELHQQTVNLLSFHDLPRELYDAQVAFNLLAAFGPESKAKVNATERRVEEQYAMLVPGDAARLTMQIVQAPVFHGYAISLLLELEGNVSLARVSQALAGGHLDVRAAETEGPSNLSAAGSSDLLVRVTEAVNRGRDSRFWLWMAADNLKFAAANAVDSALFMRGLRPRGKVQ